MIEIEVVCYHGLFVTTVFQKLQPAGNESFRLVKHEQIKTQ